MYVAMYAAADQDDLIGISAVFLREEGIDLRRLISESDERCVRAALEQSPPGQFAPVREKLEKAGVAFNYGHIRLVAASMGRNPN